ncbi:hypothetical protein BDV96DRAFT_644791 [Lophiotrema nucula]|uniref:Tat pathway signal sequence n=1 Tax=Lophiotrema nucula TaxID=690887 RepID=A0A6A5ZF67_9PLEO|nr:hypothetical protein BDV96DRAFT_644791 [Lophiotrema nucula]
MDSALYASLSSSDSQAEQQDKAPVKRHFSAEARARLWLALLGLLTIVLIVWSTVYFLHHPKDQWAKEISAWQRQKTSQTFAANELYTRAKSPETDAAWNALAPRGKGFVSLSPQQNPFDFDMEGNDRSLAVQTASIAVFHQLHCLNLLRKWHFRLLEQVLDHPTAPFNSTPELWHTTHCFDYLRQSLMCSADATPEWQLGAKLGTMGWGYRHECRDYEWLKDWAEKRCRWDIPGDLD